MLDVSTVMVIGGSGDYLDVADTVIALKEYRAEDVTKLAKAIASELPTQRLKETPFMLKDIKKRVILPESFEMRKKQKVKSKGIREIIFGDEVIDVSFVEQLVDDSQCRMIAEILKFLKKQKRKIPMFDILKELEEKVIKEGFDSISGSFSFGVAWVRRFEMASALNRMRSLKVERLSEV